ncbi:hypothetical protein Golomagni_01824 [Golovinomyces magnicellulatus]|nr:hypothetical protein Golomagni_01824 [Golovinomyces magnicellulatus]
MLINMASHPVIMGKKRKISSSGRKDRVESKNFSENDSIHHITSFEDVAGSEDEFHINRDKINFDEGPDTKKRRKWQEEGEYFELSDNEILGDPDSIDEEESSEPVGLPGDLSDENSIKNQAVHEDVNEETEGWGASKQDYYNHDLIETEADALEEEAESKRLQQMKLKKMSIADFGLNEDDWLDESNTKDNGDVVTEVLKEVEITDDMQPDERLRVLQMRYPEFEPLANDLLELYPVLKQLQNEVETQSPLHTSNPQTVIKFRALSAYVGALTMYFAIFSSGNGSTSEAQASNPAELREHTVMDSLLQCRELWSKAKNLTTPLPDNSVESPISNIHDEEPQKEKILKTEKKLRQPKRAKNTAENVRKSEATEIELQELSNLIKSNVKRATKSKSKIKIATEDSDGSDFGEEDSMDAKSAFEKAHKKKSLRFYTSQITQKSTKRMDAGRTAGGDEDVPYRERFRDRNIRLNAEAEKRGKNKDETTLNDHSDNDDLISKQVREEGNEFYDLVTRATRLKKDQKKMKNLMEAQAKAEGGWVRTVESEIGEDGKRAIGYVIEKNKGLAPKRKKDVRNPRVKKRKKFEEKKKKLASIRAIYKGGEERGGYGGEKTGIKTRLVKSIKL